jgi:glycosyltransferase involved in cell wall biosynthesis
MRIGIDFLFAQQGTTQGYDSYLRNLLSGLDTVSGEHEIIVFCNTPYYHENKSKFSNLQLFDCHGQWQNRFQRAAWMSVSLPGLARRFGMDGMYFPTHFRPLMDLGRIWTVVNLYDLQYRYIPSNFGHLQLFVRDYFYRLSLIKCTRSICISEYVKNTVREQFPYIQADRLIVIPIPIIFDIGSDLLTEESKSVLATRPYILTIGKHFPHKNFETLLRAFAILIRKIGYPGSLIIGGSFTSHTSFLRELAAELEITDRVHFTGYVSNAVRESLYRSADVFVFPSVYEGFGMPAVEAMGREVPVVCSDTTALPEVTLGLAVYYSPVTDAEALAQAVNKILQQPPKQERLREISERVRKTYNVVTISRQYLDLWESLGR